MGSPALAVQLKHSLQSIDLNVSMELKSGISVLFGPSGAGKSITLRMIAGLTKPDQGRVVLNSRILSDSALPEKWIPPQLRRIGYVFQHHALFPHMSVLQNIIYGAKNIEPDLALEAAHQLIQQFRLEGLENRHPSKISGGQKQRVALARALIGNPELLLLDEPMSALDQGTRLETQEYLKQVTARLGIATLLVTHDAQEASLLGQKIVLIENGKV